MAGRSGAGRAQETAGAVLLGDGAVLRPGASAETGFTGTAERPAGAPAAITLNGLPCRVKVR